MNNLTCPSCQPSKSTNYLIILLIPVFAILFLVLNKFNLFSNLNPSAQSSLFLFLILGLLAGFSTCTALIGGLLLSISSNWPNFKSHLIFNLSRLISFTILGAFLGLLGNFFKLSSSFSSTIIILVSFLMIYLSLPMFGIKIPKISLFSSKFTTKIFSKNNLSPILFGVFSFLLPCGFTLTAQSLALVSGNPIKGALIMLFFILGTTPSLLLIGLLSFKIYSNNRFSKVFSFTAGILILFFAFSNLFSQFHLSNYLKPNNSFSTIVDGKQIIKMSITNSSYAPNYFKVRTNMPVVWEITNKSFNSCADTINSSLFFGTIKLSPGQTITKEFTITSPGTYRFACSMGMVSGIIEAVN